MPRIDPIQLLNCLSVLLARSGGIKSIDEVQRLANLMTKFSKKLVSKCIYIQILKCTETELLGLFMGSGGWRLLHTWLTESIVSQNWPLVRELLELLLLCPVDIERLKTNNCPKLVKELSKDGNHIAIRALATKLVDQWLKTVKGEEVIPMSIIEVPKIIADAQLDINLPPDFKIESRYDIENIEKNDLVGNIELENIPKPADKENETSSLPADFVEKEAESIPVLKISVKDGKQIISQVDDIKEKLLTDKSSKDKHKSKSKEGSHDKINSSSRSKHSKSHSTSNERTKSGHRNSSHTSLTRHSRDKLRDKEKHSSHRSKNENSSKKSSDKSSSSNKLKDEKKSDKDKKDRSKDDKHEKSKENSYKAANDIDKSSSVKKLGKIPKLSDIKKEKPSISIEVRKPDDPKPKTVKTFHSKFRKHGLEEEIKPPPSRASLINKKPASNLPPLVSVPKRPSPIHNETPPEKKLKTVDIIEKPGAIKLIPPKPKPMLLLESDMFMDALNASATNKKEPKKRKRRTSGSKDGNNPNENSPPLTPINNSPDKSVPPRFYKDTLESEEDKTVENNENSEINKDAVKETEEIESHTLTINGLKGVLCYHKRKGPKKSIKWKPDSELEEIQYFELDETERVNVTKTFTDMKHLERIHEREAFQKARNLSTNDIMEEKTTWKPLIPADADGQIPVEFGKNSKEIEIQAARQKGILQALYFHKSMIPDSPAEPDPETHPYTEPTIIPLEDVTGNQDNISDFRNMPWPEPKGNAPPPSANVNGPPVYPTNMPSITTYPSAQYPNVPGYQGPNMLPGEWQNGIPPHMIPNGLPGPIPPPGMGPGGLPPGMMVTPENIMVPEMFGAPNPMFAGPPEGFNIQPNMFGPDFNMPGIQGPGPDGFPGPNNYRGGMRGRGVGGPWRGKGSGGWEAPPRGRGGHSRGNRKSMCIYFQRKGSCRQGDNCTFLHPGVNCPF